MSIDTFMKSFAKYAFENDINSKLTQIKEGGLLEEFDPLWRHTPEELHNFEQSKKTLDDIFWKINAGINKTLEQLTKEYGENNPKVTRFMQDTRDRLNDFINRKLKPKTKINGYQYNHKWLNQQLKDQNKIRKDTFDKDSPNLPNNMPQLPGKQPPPLPEKLKAICPTCKKKFSYKATLAGQKVNCPACKHPLILPSQNQGN